MPLSCKNISCVRERQTLLQNVSFDAEPGKPVIITGPNGSGKTTLLKTIAGLLTPHSGTVCWNNKNIKNCYDEYSENLQYVGHATALKNELTVEENLEFFANLGGTPEAVAPAIIYFGLTEIFDIPVAKLSEGQKRRAALARLLCSPSLICLLDEPMVNLDEEGREIINNVITTRASSGGIIIITSHSKPEIADAKIIDLLQFMPGE